MVKKLEYKTRDEKYFSILLDDKAFKVVGFEYENGIDVEKLRSLQAFNFLTEAHAKSTINKMIPCRTKI